MRRVTHTVKEVGSSAPDNVSNGTSASRQKQKTTTRITVTIPRALDRKLEMFSVALGVQKNQLLASALDDFFTHRSQDIHVQIEKLLK